MNRIKKMMLFIGILAICVIVFNFSKVTAKHYLNIVENQYSICDYHKVHKVFNKYIEYRNDNLGYQLSYPSYMELNETLNPIKTIISDNYSQIEIYYDNFKNTIHSPTAYVNYSNNFINNKEVHIKDYEKNIFINGMKTHLLAWHRAKLARVKNDKNYYISAEIIKNINEVYTIFIKSSKPFTNNKYLQLINTFKAIDKTDVKQLNVKFKNTNKKFNKETEQFYEEYFLRSNSLIWGIFENTAPKSFDFLNSLEKKLDFKFEFLLKYQCLSSGGFPMAEMLNAYNHNRYVELTLQTSHLDGQDNNYITYEILQGDYDEFLNSYAKQVKAFNHPILFRLNNEMNGDWCVYSSYYSSKDTELYKEVWRYIYNIFKQNKVDNALWVWNPHDLSFPGFTWNHYLNYYPGDEFVDLVGITGYNTGTYFEGEVWRDFKQVYVALYKEYHELFEQPFIITEFGSNSVGGDKVNWINEMFNNIKQFSNIKVAIWWNGIDWDSDKNPGRIYRLDETAEVIRTFKKGFAQYK
ncbi:endoglucanase [Clostridium sp. 'deep sea']|uniref:glycoside hydrolase family 26 protein n=1 Tax=Clostridium sp. 'deep sea' TaxID=2779445 RepID=UPI0018967F3C|nr:glycosyl hydrolase [Clostridium sp. 'deep sea']QOR34912.1 endoglucanase [Clostridium sp. 'deep sea']